MSESASVEVLSPRSGYFQVGNGQITLSMWMMHSMSCTGCSEALIDVSDVLQLSISRPAVPAGAS
jgi:hypothetical protein